MHRLQSFKRDLGGCLKHSHPRHCERSEAIQSAANAKLD
jgi:hypothetical protein